MSSRRRLTREERFAIARDRAAGVAVSVLAKTYGVTPRAIHYTLRNEKNRRMDGGTKDRVVNVRITGSELRALDEALARWGIHSRADALRRLIQVASDVFVPDEALEEELRLLGASLGRVGNNVNQIARRLNEASMKGRPPPYGQASDREIRAFAGFVFDLADQVQDLAQRRRSGLRLQVEPALRGFANAAD